MRVRLAAMGALAATLAAGSAALADGNDLALNRLTYYNSAPSGTPEQWQFRGGCGTSYSMYAACRADDQLFANLVNELGGALAPPLLSGADTVGQNGLYFAYEHTITGISGNQDYWQRGTEGNVGTNANPNTPLQVRNQTPNQLFVSHFHVRKGLPLGFELGLHVSYVHDSSMVALGADVRWALFEGFRSGIGFLPDFAVRGSVNTLVGNQQLYLTIIGVDAMLSKRISIAGVANLTPYIGGQALFILGDSTVIDATPGRSSYEECTRRHTVYNADGTSSLACDSGMPAPGGVNDSSNEVVFNPVRILRGRGIAGLRLRVGWFTIGGEFLYDLIDPQWLQGQSSVAGRGRPVSGGSPSDITITMPHQWQVSLGIGMQF